MLGFTIRYLRGSVTAADVSHGAEKDRVEWPPHPDRLFCALVQAWADAGCPKGGRRALEWLEGLAPPLIQCGELLSSHAVQHYVPVNDNWSPVNNDGKPFAPIQDSLLARDRKPRRFAVGTLDEEVVHLWWPDAAPTPDLLSELGRLAGGVACLGHTSSLVAVDLISKTDGLAPNWLPGPEGTLALRVPTPGRLRELVEAYAQNRRPPISDWAPYAAVKPSMVVPRGHHRDLIIFRLAGDRPPLPLEAAARVTAVWRSALLARADQPVIEAISGHAPGSTPDEPQPSLRPHLALLPLADVGHQFARGHMLGLAAALPAQLTAAERRACLRALGRVDELTLGPLGLWRLERCGAAERRVTLLAETWSRPSRLWSSVTPVVLGKYPRELWGDEARQLIRGACSIAGLPEPDNVAVAPVAWILGVPPAFRFPPLPSRPGKPRRAHVHVLLEFDRPVAGPVLVGAGRHLGYGIFRQLSRGQQ